LKGKKDLQQRRDFIISNFQLFSKEKNIIIYQIIFTSLLVMN